MDYKLVGAGTTEQSSQDAARAAMRLHLTNSRERLRHAHEEAESQRA